MGGAKSSPSPSVGVGASCCKHDVPLYTLACARVLAVGVPVAATDDVRCTAGSVSNSESVYQSGRARKARHQWRQ